MRAPSYEEVLLSSPDQLSTQDIYPTYAKYLKDEARATRIRALSPRMIPGLLQRPDFAAAINQLPELASRFSGLPGAVNLRMGRQRKLERTDAQQEYFIGIDGITRCRDRLMNARKGPIVEAQFDALLNLMEAENQNPDEARVKVRLLENESALPLDPAIILNTTTPEGTPTTTVYTESHWGISSPYYTDVETVGQIVADFESVTQSYNPEQRLGALSLQQSMERLEILG